jgi:hypothetical protein
MDAAAGDKHPPVPGLLQCKNRAVGESQGFFDVAAKEYCGAQKIDRSA